VLLQPVIAALTSMNDPSANSDIAQEAIVKALAQTHAVAQVSLSCIQQPTTITTITAYQKHDTALAICPTIIQKAS
jgi:hypothetical protein